MSTPATPHPLVLDAPSIAEALAGRRGRGLVASAPSTAPPPPLPAVHAALRYDFMPDSLKPGRAAPPQRGALTLDADGRVELVRAGGRGDGGVLFAGRRDLAVPARGGLGGGAGTTTAASASPSTSTPAGDMVDCVAIFEGGAWTLHALTGGAANLR